MAEAHAAFSIESFYKFVSEGKLMGAKCSKCGAVMLPPRPVCNNCLGKDLRWVELKGRGKLLTYTVIHVAPQQFEAFVPYPIGIVKLEEGPQLLGMIRNIEPSKLKIGMELTIDFEKPSSSTQTQWPTWPRYFFKPI
jgi:uncharacterized OB-fold protein